jgi:hypothetical protein
MRLDDGTGIAMANHTHDLELRRPCDSRSNWLWRLVARHKIERIGFIARARNGAGHHHTDRAMGRPTLIGAPFMASSFPGRLALALAIGFCCGTLVSAADEPTQVQPPGKVPRKARPKPAPPKKVDVSLHVLTELSIFQVVIDTQPFVAWVKPLIAAMEAKFRDESKRRTVVIQVTLQPDRPAELAVAGQPAPSDTEIKDLLGAANAQAAPQTKRVDCSFRLVAKINGGHPDEKLDLRRPTSGGSTHSRKPRRPRSSS